MSKEALKEGTKLGIRAGVSFTAGVAGAALGTAATASGTAAAGTATTAAILATTGGTIAAAPVLIPAALAAGTGAAVWWITKKIIK